MGGEFTSNAVDRGLIDGWIKPKSLKLIFVTSPLKTQYEQAVKADWLPCNQDSLERQIQQVGSSIKHIA